MVGKNDDPSGVYVQAFKLLTDSVQAIGVDVRQARETAIRTETSVQAIGAQLDEQKVTLRKMPDKVRRTITEHQTVCPAHVNFMAKAAAPSLSPSPVSSPTETGFSFPKIPRTLLTACIGIGVVIGVAALVMWKAGMFG